MAQTLHPTIEAVTRRIRERSAATRGAYLDQMNAARSAGRNRDVLSCGNLAHGFAACGGDDKRALKDGGSANVGIVTAFNDMLSAHQPLETYPGIIKDELARLGSVGQVAGGVPAMCDGVTQGQPGMELSLFSRDVIAMSTAVSLSHNMFDAALCLGVCDKIVPGLLIGALRFGHLPVIFVPAGPMRSGLSNPEKARIRQLVCRGQGRSRCPARRREQELSLAGHVYLLRDGQLQPVVDGDHGAAHSRHRLHQPDRPDARVPHACGGEPCGRDHR